MEKKFKLMIAGVAFLLSLACLHYDLPEIGATLAMVILFGTQAMLSEGN
jgi:hypothetical protein